jgi:hypothetical protein
VRLAGTAAITLLLGLGAGFLVGTQAAGQGGAVELHVPGAMNISVFCGEETVHGQGTRVRFLARDRECEVEISLSPVMPLRGSLQVAGPGAYRCQREGMELLCSGPQ